MSLMLVSDAVNAETRKSRERHSLRGFLFFDRRKDH
jgi:hypothetical protein